MVDRDDSENTAPPTRAGERPTRAGERQTQKWSVIFLCFYGFMSQLKPGEPFITPLLLSTEKNFTREQVTNEISPVISYAYLAMLVPIFLLTDYLRYKPLLVLQSLSHVSIWLLLLLGTTLLQMQFMEVFYGVTMATRVAYSSYIFSLVTPALYQRVASYSRSSLLLGLFVSSTLGQLCVSLGGIPYLTLSAVSLGFVCFTLLLSFCLPWPRRSMFFNPAHWEETAHFELDKITDSSPVSPSSSPQPAAASSGRGSVFFSIVRELRDVVRIPSLRLWSLWWVSSSAGYYVVLFYIHILWNQLYPATENKHVYNGGVEAASTLLGVCMSFAAGFVKIKWDLWSELLISFITALQAGLLLLIVTTNNIWVCYLAYILFRGLYQFLMPIATFQIATSLTKELCALVFGINTFLGAILKTLIIITVADRRGLGLPVYSQFLVYFFYYTLLTVIFLGSAAWVIVKHYCNKPTGGAANEVSPLENNLNQPDQLVNGANVKT